MGGTSVRCCRRLVSTSATPTRMRSRTTTTTSTQFMLVESRSDAGPGTPPEPMTTGAALGEGDGVTGDEPPGVNAVAPLPVCGSADEEEVDLPLLGAGVGRTGGGV